MDETPSLVAHLRAPLRAANMYTTAEAAEATGRDSRSIRIAMKRGLFSRVCKESNPRPNASYLIPVDELAKVFPIKHQVTTRTRSDELLYTRCLQMIIFSGVRADMICSLRWSQIKEKDGLIIYKRHEHKGGYKQDFEVNVVLTDGLMEILNAMKERRDRLGLTSDFVFVHGPTTFGLDRFFNRPLNVHTVNRCLKRALAQVDAIETKDATVHGFRTTFSTWALDLNSYTERLVNATLGHKQGTEVDRVYFRNVHKLKERRDMMTEWERFCLSLCQPQSATK